MTRKQLTTLLSFLVFLVALYVVQTYPDLFGLAPESDAPEKEAARSSRTRPRVTPGAPSVATGSGASIKGSWYEIAFTAPRYPDDPDTHMGGLDERLVAFMDQSKRTLDVADYDFDLQNVAEAMARAAKRGVRVRMVTDTDTLTDTKNEEIQSAFKILKDAKIPIVEDKRSPIMHDKFTVADGEWVSTGSWNYTDGDTYRLNNWMGVFQNKQLAENYAAEFEQMFGGKFGPNKANLVKNPTIKADGATVQTCFSPPGKCDQVVVNAVKNAKTSLRFMAFSFTHDGIGDAIAERAKAGVSTIGVFENTGSQTQFSEFGRLKQQGVEVYTDGNPYVRQ
ncbi:MAG: phospholipase D-like domain-containing protein [Chloroflexi bacterium]|nr:phospholipase D-like domain-containing protein [Chloroflexota bacterium]